MMHLHPPVTGHAQGLHGSPGPGGAHGPAGSETAAVALVPVGAPGRRVGELGGGEPVVLQGGEGAQSHGGIRLQKLMNE
ncbi:hypothetical protein CEXT_597171 [Caerostris extrusa]|uniref:Uncharacterized protein n=1 Tax=Caerostris extrusa TaxID=172846 RepID=A0AAV4U8G9_CAEEX|nr:hypothetical protein CEXT_597171 [Caerostris extrusa]